MGRNASSLVVMCDLTNVRRNLKFALRHIFLGRARPSWDGLVESCTCCRCCGGTPPHTGPLTLDPPPLTPDPAWPWTSPTLMITWRVLHCNVIQWGRVFGLYADKAYLFAAMWGSGNMMLVMQDADQFLNFLHSLGDMGAAMRTVITKALTSREIYQQLNEGRVNNKTPQWFSEGRCQNRATPTASRCRDACLLFYKNGANML